MARESIIRKIKRFNQDVDEYINVNLSRRQKLKMFLDFMIEYRFKGAYLQDYIQYEFYKKNRLERQSFIVHGKLLEIMKICNNPKHRYIFDEKPEFNRRFQKYLGRDWIDLSTASLEEFETFLKRKEQIFVKDSAGMFGQGVDLISTDDIKSVTSLYKKLKKRHALCEEVIEQNHETGGFNPSSANTMRIVTLITADNNVQLMAAVMRIGRAGKHADNFHHNGIAALIDIETGLIKTTGVDRNFKRYVVHPDSKKPIVGFQVPEWEKIKETVTNAAKVVPDMRYIGWDVAVDKNHQIVLIEGNPGADPDVTQIPDQIGKWPLYEPYLEEIKLLKN